MLKLQMACGYTKFSISSWMILEMRKNLNYKLFIH